MAKQLSAKLLSAKLLVQSYVMECEIRKSRLRVGFEASISSFSDNAMKVNKNILRYRSNVPWELRFAFNYVSHFAEITELTADSIFRVLIARVK